jgi:hypothetical protein
MNFILAPKTENVLPPRINGLELLSLNLCIFGLNGIHHHYDIGLPRLTELAQYLNPKLKYSQIKS